MSQRAPLIDTRTAEDFARQLEALIPQYAPEWNELDPATGRATGISAGLIGVFARYAELIAQRLNRAPDKNLLAFLDRLGASPLPPQPARVPLTFMLADGASGACVPAGTQVVAQTDDGPVTFETERELSLSAARIAALYSWDAVTDSFADGSAAADVQGGIEEGVKLFAGSAPIEHALYIGLDALRDAPRLVFVYICAELFRELPQPFDPREVIWEIWDGERATPLSPLFNGVPDEDLSRALTQTGNLRFEQLPEIPQARVGGVLSRWLRCRLKQPLTQSADPVDGHVRHAHLPQLLNWRFQLFGISPLQLPDAAFLNALPLDATRDFYPWGSTPQYGDTLYLAHREVFSQQDRQIDVVITPSEPAARRNLTVASDERYTWEYWNGRDWVCIGVTTPGNAEPQGNSQLYDPSHLRNAGRISFYLHEPPQPAVVNGIESYWLRIRVTGGTFAKDSGPSLGRIQLCSHQSEAPLPDVMLASDGLRLHRVDPEQACTAFTPADDTGRSSYLMLDLPGAAALPQRDISLYFETLVPRFGSTPDNAAAHERPRIAWQYWNGSAWAPLSLRDDTQALTQPGNIGFLPPADFARTALFGREPGFWLRAVWQGGDYAFLPRLRRVLLNTVPAAQQLTLRDEVLGSSTGEAAQRFTLAHTPVLAGLQLQVREPEPGSAERTRVLAEEGSDAITPSIDGSGDWVRWHEVSDFHASGARDRHYVLDHITGEVSFGDGHQGLIPPTGSGNLRAALYRSGGGAQGNRPAGEITQLKTTLPYVASVTHHMPAGGGVGAESEDELRSRAPRGLRHGHRAVTLEDYQDLAQLASPEVARSLCVPLRDLSVDFDGTQQRTGVVSVIVVPRSQALKPTPGVELTARVREHLQRSGLPTAEVIVVGPEYISVDVQAEIALASLEGAQSVEQAVQSALQAFLHPLSGGLDGHGWDFGREPHKSDLYALLAALPGVDHVRALRVNQTPDREGAGRTGRFLVCSGTHRISLAFGN